MQTETLKQRVVSQQKQLQKLTGLALGFSRDSKIASLQHANLINCGRGGEGWDKGWSKVDMDNSIIITKNLLQSFIKQKRLSNVVAFLDFIKKDSGLKDFYNFCSKSNYKLSEQIFGKILFHGSAKKQIKLIPHASIGRDGIAEQEAFIYATDDPNYAIFLALLHLNKFGLASVYVSSKNTKLSVNIGFVNGSSKLSDGYIHIVSRQFFKQTKNREYKTNKSVNILFSIPVTPQDLTVPIHIQTKT